MATKPEFSKEVTDARAAGASGMMIEWIKTALNRPIMPVSKAPLLAFLRWQIAFLCLAMIFAVLDMTGVMQVRASGILVFIFFPLGGLAGAYLQVKEAGLEGSDATLGLKK